MTAKEKAEELFDKMAFEVCGTDAKICALIAVNEIIDEHLSEGINTYVQKRIDYWAEVKHEIEQL
jgi:endo-beta-N-acetylglucosaminidase D